MKRLLSIVFVISLFLALSVVSFGQITELGIRGGLNLAKLDGDDIGDEMKNKTGFVAGG